MPRSPPPATAASASRSTRRRAGWTLANPEDAKPVMAALLGGASRAARGRVRNGCGGAAFRSAPDGEVRLVATTRAMQGDAANARLSSAPAGGRHRLRARRRSGRGDRARRRRRSTQAGLARGIGRAASPRIDLKADEPAILEAAEHFGVPARFFSAAALEAETPRLKNPSEAVFREVGCHGVAEGAALAAAGAGRPARSSPRRRARASPAPSPRRRTIIDAASVGRARGRLAIVGIGPGAADWLTPEARRLLQTSDAAVGYSLYLDLVAPLIAQRRALRFRARLGGGAGAPGAGAGRRGPLRRARLSGDAGIYAMATPASSRCLGAQRAMPRPACGRLAARASRSSSRRASPPCRRRRRGPARRSATISAPSRSPTC